MTPEQFNDLKALLTTMLTPVRDLALYQLQQNGQPVPAIPTTRSILDQQAAAAEAERRAPVGAGPSNTGPYTVHAAPGSNLGDPALPEHPAWNVMGVGGISVGFVGTRAEADTEADRLNRLNRPGAAPFGAGYPSGDNREGIGRTDVSPGYPGTGSALPDGPTPYPTSGGLPNNPPAPAVPALRAGPVSHTIFHLPNDQWEVRGPSGGFLGTEAEATTEMNRLNALPA